MVDGARLLLVRHGRHDWLYPPINRFAGHLPGVHLNADGRVEAGALSRRLQTSPPDRIVSSPVERAVETATIIAETLGRAVTTDERITETGMGSWEGLPVPEVIARFPAQWHAWRTAPTTADIPGMEKVEAIGARMLTAAVDYLEQGGATLLVSPYSVNCDTTRAEPPTSSTDRLSFPASSSKIRRWAIFCASIAA